MKTLILLGALATSPACFADEPAGFPKSIRVDLDGDGRPDSVTIRRTGAAKDTLEVALTASGRTFSFANLLDNPEGPEPICGGTGESSLTAGRAAFTVAQHLGSTDVCQSESYLGATVKLVNGELTVTRITRGSKSWSSGDPSPVRDSVFDLARGRVTVSATDMHSHESRVPTATEALGGTCARTLTLAALDARGVPACLKRQAFYMVQELTGGYDDLEQDNRCPVLDGIYRCQGQSTDGPVTRTLVSIRRVHGALFSYDLPSFSRELKADGKKYPLEHGGPKDFELTTCRRDTLSHHSREYVDGWSTTLPYSKRDTVWTQDEDDTEGKKFRMVETLQTLSDERGHYGPAYVATLSCVREERP